MKNFHEDDLAWLILDFVFVDLVNLFVNYVKFIDPSPLTFCFLVYV